MSSTRKVCLILALGLCLLSTPACYNSGRTYYPVSGTVEFRDGSPATFGSIEFRSESEPVVVARGKINRDGAFSVDASGRTGTVEGWHTVAIAQPVKDAYRGVVHHHGLDAAKKYLDHRTTDLRVEVTAESGNGELVLTIDAKD